MTPPLLLLLACTGSAPAPVTDGPTLTTVRLALNWFPEPEFGGFYEAELSGIYEEAGFDVTIIPGGPGAPSLELVSTGRAEAAITAADDLLVKRSRGIQARAVYAAFQDVPVGIMVHAGAGIARFSDITDGQIAIEIGTPFQSYLWERYGWGAAVQPVPYGGGVGAFVNDPAHRQQGYITSEPCLARSQGAEVTFLRARDAGWNPYAVVLAVADPPPPWVADFVAATKRGWDAYMADPSRANAEISKLNDQMKPELMDCITAAQAPYVTGGDASALLGRMDTSRWEETASALVALGLLPAGSTAAGAWSGF